ncbi:hypothetical protein JTB14_003449 [Gonioctena quinquepunctata]|nr:hypothetical protein JTB14_003449 [Gonioctena quinquepunctata]
MTALFSFVKSHLGYGKCKFKSTQYQYYPTNIVEPFPGQGGKPIPTLQDGRSVKTYGVSQGKVTNMRFAHLSIVIVLSCSVCASGDLEIFPGWKFGFNDEDQRSRIRRFDHPNYYSKFISPFQSLPISDYEPPETRGLPEYESLPDRADKIRQFQEVIDWEKSHLSQHKQHRTHHRNPEFEYNMKNINLGIPILNDALRYPYGYRVENGERDEEKVNFAEDFGKLRNDEKFGHDTSTEDEEFHSSHHEVDSKASEGGEKLSTERFKDVKMVDDPTEFAYAPPDPRYYRKTEEVDETDSTEKNEETLETASGSAGILLKVDQRSEQNSVESRSDEPAAVKSSQQQNEGIEMVAVKPSVLDGDSAGVYVIAIVAGISAAATVGLIAVGIGWYNLQKHVKNASDVDYPAYGVTGPNKDLSPSGDRRLAQSAQMYHYQHQKQQIIAMERAPPNERNGSVSDAESDEENEEGDYTVYECPGLAPTGEMEVKNPLFQDDTTPAQTPALKANGEAKK